MAPADVVAAAVVTAGTAVVVAAAVVAVVVVVAAAVDNAVASVVAASFAVATRLTLLRPGTSLHLTVEVMSVKEVQAVNFVFLVTKATIDSFFRIRNCFLTPGQNYFQSLMLLNPSETRYSSKEHPR